MIKITKWEDYHGSRNLIRGGLRAKFTQKEAGLGFAKFFSTLDELEDNNQKIDACHFERYGEFEIQWSRAATKEEKQEFLKQKKESGAKYDKKYKERILREAKRLKLL